MVSRPSLTLADSAPKPPGGSAKEDGEPNTPPRPLRNERGVRPKSEALPVGFSSDVFMPSPTNTFSRAPGLREPDSRVGPIVAEEKVRVEVDPVEVVPRLVDLALVLVVVPDVVDAPTFNSKSV